MQVTNRPGSSPSATCSQAASREPEEAVPQGAGVQISRCLGHDESLPRVREAPRAARLPVPGQAVGSADPYPPVRDLDRPAESGRREGHALSRGDRQARCPAVPRADPQVIPVGAERCHVGIGEPQLRGGDVVPDQPHTQGPVQQQLGGIDVPRADRAEIPAGSPGVLLVVQGDLGSAQESPVACPALGALTRRAFRGRGIDRPEVELEGGCPRASAVFPVRDGQGRAEDLRRARGSRWRACAGRTGRGSRRPARGQRRPRAPRTRRRAESRDTGCAGTEGYRGWPGASPRARDARRRGKEVPGRVRRREGGRERSAATSAARRLSSRRAKAAASPPGRDTPSLRTNAARTTAATTICAILSPFATRNGSRP